MRTGPWSRGRSLPGCSRAAAAASVAVWNRRSQVRGTLVVLMDRARRLHIRRQPCRSVHRLMLSHPPPLHGHSHWQLLLLQATVGLPTTKQQQRRRSMLAICTCASRCSPERTYRVGSCHRRKASRGKYQTARTSSSWQRCRRMPQGCHPSASLQRRCRLLHRLQVMSTCTRRNLQLCQIHTVGSKKGDSINRGSPPQAKACSLGTTQGVKHLLRRSYRQRQLGSLSSRHILSSRRIRSSRRGGLAAWPPPPPPHLSLVQDISRQRSRRGSKAALLQRPAPLHPATLGRRCLSMQHSSRLQWSKRPAPLQRPAPSRASAACCRPSCRACRRPQPSQRRRRRCRRRTRPPCSSLAAPPILQRP